MRNKGKGEQFDKLGKKVLLENKEKFTERTTVPFATPTEFFLSTLTVNLTLLGISAWLAR